MTSEMIYDFLAESSQRAAQKIVETILSKTKQLEVFPNLVQDSKYQKLERGSIVI
jgi:hypothetical protein